MNSQDAFFALLRAGLWGKEVRLLPCNDINYSQIFRLAEEQVVVGLVTAGLGHVQDFAVPQTVKLLFVGKSMQIEQTNLAMNQFIGEVVTKMRNAELFPLLVKGQGIAQCYERPLWRASGDIDLLFDEKNYNKAIKLLKPLASNCKQEGRYSKHLGLSVGQWYVELHGTMRSGLSSRVDREIDAVLGDTFKNHKVRVWNDGETAVNLPLPDNDVFIVFTHFIKHFYKERLTLRQLCDWCRLLWTYRDEIDAELLSERLQMAGLMNEWRAFATLAVDYLDMPVEAMSMYVNDIRWHKKGEKILSYLMNLHTQKLKNVGQIFPSSTMKFLPSIFFNLNGLKIKERLLSA